MLRVDRWRGWLVVLAVVGCGRLNFDENTCWPAWRTNALRFASVRPLTELNTPGFDGDPWLSDDARKLVYSSGGTGGLDIYEATRANRSSLFDPPVRRDDLSSAGEDTKVTMTPDELYLVESSNRLPSQGGYDLWAARRATRSDNFVPTTAPVGTLNTVLHELDPHLSTDGLRLYYTADTNPNQEIRVASRASRDDAFGPAVRVDGLGIDYTADATLSGDELVIAYSAAVSLGDIYYASREGIDELFSNAQAVPDVNSSEQDGNSFLSADGCELVFSSLRSGNADLYLGTVLR